MNRPEPLDILPLAIERKDWELAGLCIVAAALDLAQALPADALEAMLEELEGGEGRSRRRTGRERQR